MAAVAVGALLLILLGRSALPPIEGWLGVALLATIAAVGNLPARTRQARRIHSSLLGTLMLAAIPLGLSAGIPILAFAHAIVQVGRQPKQRILFNMAMSTIIGLCGALVYSLLDGPVSGDGSPAAVTTVLAAGLALLVADIAQLLCNAGLISAILWASRGVSVTDQFRNLVLRGTLGYLATGLLSLLIYVLWVLADGGPWSIVLLVPSLVAAQWALGHERSEDLAQVQVVDTLNAAMDARHPGSARHAADVARLSEWLAEEVDLGPAKSIDLALAGALLRLDTLAAPTTGGPVHRPSRALSGVSFLEHIVPVIEHRPTDPAAAAALRIVAVADAYAEARRSLGDLPTARYLACDLVAGDPSLDRDVIEALRRVVERLDPLPDEVRASAAEGQ
ncbi:MAG TPA: hypothetical protein PLK69_04655 [Tetrasphaera sp.]|nr:hypothetical protein [Tetrasphaera sp.]